MTPHKKETMKTFGLCIIVAMRSEAMPLVDTLGLKKQEGILPRGVPFECFTGKSGHKQISVVLGGSNTEHGVDNVGTLPASLMTWLAIEHLDPDLIVNAGTAGGIAEQGCEVGDVFLSEGDFCFHDRRIPLPGYREYGVGSHPSVDTSEMAASLGYKRGRISTGDSLDMTDTDLEMIQANKAVLKEMEAAAVAWVCRMTETPMFAVKVVTDLIDRSVSTEKQFTANLRRAVSNLKQSVSRIVEYL